ncbi:MAG: FAD:protein FMN transferase [Lachnospiraceae bacterium]|nr:FAD:protein FMN transferase [Lachnospiraceae bacterium]
MKRSVKRSLCILLSAAVLLCSGCGKNAEPVSKTEFYFDTVITITLYDDLKPERSEEILNGCFALCETYEAMLSRTKKGSDIWNINHAGGAPVKVNGETAALIEKALTVCRQTDGAVDITIAPLSSLWNFSSEHLTEQKEIPSQEQIGALLPHVDYHNVLADGDTVTLTDPDASIDLGCIAKGYIADRLKQYLLEEGCTSAIVNLGGNVLTLGHKPDGTDFRLGIQKPFAGSGESIAVLPVADQSLVSSGVYERYFEENGRRYHHLLNPKTGMPENNGLLSVSILSDSSTDGDILSTACFLLGPDDGMAYVESLPGVEAVFITEDYSLHPSSGLSGLLQTP